MNILAIETTGAKASVSVINEKGQIFEEICTEKLNHLQYLMPMVEKVLEKGKLQIGDLTAIAASEGPGSFTGIRIGVSSVRALAQALKLECISVPTLKTFLYNTPNYKGIYCPIFDARRSQVYGAAYKWGEESSILEIVEGKPYALSDYLGLLKKALEEKYDEVTFFGDGVETYKTQIEEWQNSSLNSNIQIKIADAEIRYQKSSSVAKLALELFNEGELCQYNDLKPNYMRKPEAERKLDEAKAAQNKR